MATVLVVDDEFGIVELVEAILTDEGHCVVSAANGRHGLEVLAKEHPDLIFLDYMMPVMNGAATLLAIAADPALQHIPVVVISVMAEAAVAERCSGYTRFLHKSFKAAQLVAITEQLLGQSAGPDA